jgi:hypothetical protein
LAAEPPNGPSGAARIIAKNLRIDAATAEVLNAFSAAGVESLLLKGASLARWLYDAGEPRPQGDFDLLVPPSDRPIAEQVLSELGFERSVDEREMPSWWRDHGVAWLRHDDAVALDLHRTLTGVGVDENRLWTTLSQSADTIVVGKARAATLPVHGLAFHVALHAAQHGQGWDDMLAELDRAIQRADMATWRAAADLAESLDATAAFATGLRLVPAGRELADELGLPASQPLDVALRAGTPPPIALGFDQLSRATGVRARLSILRHKLLPPPTFIRHQFPEARASRLALALAYVKRWRFLLRNAPGGFRAWRSARRGSPAD